MDTPSRVNPTTMPGNGQIGRTIDQAASATHQSINKVADAARPAVDRLKSGAHDAVDRLADVAGQAADTLSDKGGQLKEMQQRVFEECRVYMRSNPITSLGIAVAAGYFLSRILTSRSS
ncbi:MAG: hypothetical protein ABI661_00985 [Gammaproteobacteria bacterium]